MSEFHLRRHLKWRVKQSELEKKTLYHPTLQHEYLRREIISPDFVFQNSKWALCFYTNQECSPFCLYLKKRDVNPYFPFQTTCFAQCHPQTEIFSVSVTSCEPQDTDQEIWFPPPEFLMETRDLFSVESILFTVVIDGIPLGLDAETADKCTNTGSDLAGLSSDFGDLLESGEASDVRLKCKGVTRPAHWSVLTARSEVFAAMLRSKMTESISGVVEIDDLDETLLDLFLSYIYTGNLSKLSEDRTHELYSVADKYSVYLLQKLCSRRMIQNLSAQNYQLFLEIADFHSDEHFKGELIASIADHPEWLDCPTWLEFSNVHPTLATYVYHKLYMKTFKKT